MNIQRLPETIIRFLVIIGGIGLALFSVKLAGFGNYGKLAMIFLGLGYIALTLIVGPRMWVAIPVVWGLSGQIPELGLPFTVRDLTVMLVFVTCLIFRAFKKFNRESRYEWVDSATMVLVLYIATCWIRNPVGVEALGSDRVGGRPYFNIFIACLAYLTLSVCSLKAGSANRLVLAMTGFRMLEGVAAQLLKWVPSLAGFFVAYYTCTYFSWAYDDGSMPVAPGAESTGRLGYLVAIGQPLALCLCSFCVPLKLLSLIRFWRPLLLSVSLICILFSGFRSAIAAVFGYFVVSAYAFKGMSEVRKMAMVGGVLLTMALLCQGTLFDLPLSAQRALSFLPGQWDAYAKLEAEESTKWRTDMWKEMLATDRYIENQWLGDGFGFTKRDLDLMIHFKKKGDVASGQESFMISGNVHSGPVSSIKYAGYVGLAIVMVVLIGTALAAWKLIKLARGTPFFHLALFVCIPPIVEPFFFTLVFGAFDTAVVDSLYGLGMLRMVKNSLEEAAVKVPVAELDSRTVPLAREVAASAG